MRATTSARAFNCAARTGVFCHGISATALGVAQSGFAQNTFAQNTLALGTATLSTLVLSLAVLGAAPAKAGGNEDDQTTTLTVPARPSGGARRAGPAPAHRYDPAVDYQTIVIGGGSQPDVIVDMSVLDALMSPPAPRPRAPSRPAPRPTRPAAPAAPDVALIAPEAPAAEPEFEPPAPETALPEPASTEPALPTIAAPEPAVAEPTVATPSLPEPEPEPTAPETEPAPAPAPITVDADTPRTLAMIELGSRLGEPAAAEPEAPPPPPAPKPAPEPAPPPPARTGGVGSPTDLIANLPSPVPAPEPIGGSAPVPEPARAPVPAKTPEPEPPAPEPPASEPSPEPAAAPSAPPPPATAVAAVPAPAVAGRSGLPSVAKQVTQVAFATSGDTLDDDGRAALDAVVDQLKEPGGRILVRGFASGTNDTATGARRLSRQRVLAVRTYLIEKGVPATLIDLRAVGMAPDAPVADGVDIAIMP